MLLGQMTLSDKINMVTGAGFSEPYVFYISAIPSLCVPAIGEEEVRSASATASPM